MPASAASSAMRRDGERRLFGGLDDDGIAGGQGRSELPRGHEQGIVPRHHGGDDADRLAGDERDRSRGDMARSRHRPCRRPRRTTGCLDRARNVAAGGDRDRLAHVEGFEQRQLVLVLRYEVGEFQQGLLALGRVAGGPCALLEGGAGGGHGAVHVLHIACGHLRQHLAINRRDAIEGLAAGGRHMLAVDEGLVAVGEGGDQAAIVGAHGMLRR